MTSATRCSASAGTLSITLIKTATRRSIRVLRRGNAAKPSASPNRPGTKKLPALGRGVEEFWGTDMTGRSQSVSDH